VSVVNDNVWFAGLVGDNPETFKTILFSVRSDTWEEG
jgi:hypothetical protein